MAIIMKLEFKWLLLFPFLLQGITAFRVVCVYTNWSQYRPDIGKFVPEDVDPTLCTHLIYVYAKLKGNKLIPSEWNDDGNAWSEGMFQRVQNLKQLNPELKTLLGVGGWMMGSKDFSRMASRLVSRRMFATSTVKFLRERDFDGLTIDWQYPTKRGGKPYDRKNFSLLLKELNKAFQDESKKSMLPPLLLTVGVAGGREIIDSAYEFHNITSYVDFINVMAYDLHGPWDNYTGHPSQLYARQEEFGPATEINVDAVMKHWISNVPDRSKLVLGVSTYGRSFKLRKNRHNQYGVPTTGPGTAGDYTKQPGMLAFYERCSQYADATRVWDDHSKVAYWYRGDQWLAGEDVESIKAKVNWIRRNEIGGIMFSNLDMDDFHGGFCTGEIYPLLTAIHEQMLAPLPPLVQSGTRSPFKPRNTHSKLVKGNQQTNKQLQILQTEVQQNVIQANSQPPAILEQSILANEQHLIQSNDSIKLTKIAVDQKPSVQINDLSQKKEQSLSKQANTEQPTVQTNLHQLRLQTDNVPPFILTKEQQIKPTDTQSIEINPQSVLFDAQIRLNTAPIMQEPIVQSTASLLLTESNTQSTTPTYLYYELFDMTSTQPNYINSSTYQSTSAKPFAGSIRQNIIESRHPPPLSIYQTTTQTASNTFTNEKTINTKSSVNNVMKSQVTTPITSMQQPSLPISLRSRAENRSENVQINAKDMSELKLSSLRPSSADDLTPVSSQNLNNQITPVQKTSLKTQTVNQGFNKERQKLINDILTVFLSDQRNSFSSLLNGMQQPKDRLKPVLPVISLK